MPQSQPKGPAPAPLAAWPDNPVLTRIWRDGSVESQHRGAWALVDSSGSVVDSAGAVRHPIFPRSALKALQALPLLESGAAERFSYREDEVALALASHNAEPCHVERVARVLRRLGLETDDLQCGPQPPGDGEARRALVLAGEQPSALHNNCSGKHAGFLALGLHLGVETPRYLEPGSASQVLVREAIAAMAGLEPDDLGLGIDGCSAPTFRMPLVHLATALARVANPDGLPDERRAACRRMQSAVATYPELIAGTRRRLCTDLARVTKGRLFPKIGSEGVYVIGAVGRDLGLAIKVDDGNERGLNALILDLCRRLGWIGSDEADALAEWQAGPISNWAGQEVGRVEVVA
jgi:L-asparaginase II